MNTVKKKLENIVGGEEFESEAGGVEREHGQPDDSDDVIGPPLPPGYKVRLRSAVEGHTLSFNHLPLFCRILRLVLVVLRSTTVRGRGQRRRRKMM